MREYFRTIVPNQRFCCICLGKLGRTAYGFDGTLHCKSCRAVATKSAPSMKYSRLCVWIGPFSTVCSLAQCGDWIPADYYYASRRRFFCSADCGLAARGHRPSSSICSKCGKAYNRAYNAKFDYCCAAERNQEKTDEVLRGQAGEYYDVLRRFLLDLQEDYSQKTIRGYRPVLGRFFLYLRDIGVTDLNAVSGSHIIRFRAWCGKHGFVAPRQLSGIKLLFNWLIVEGIRTSTNPFDPKRHNRSRSRRNRSNPYSQDEQCLIWRILDLRGTPIARVVVAVVEESGLHFDEVVGLRITDISLSRRIFTGPAFANGEEEAIPFHDKAAKYLAQWLDLRPPSRTDRLFVHGSGKPVGKDALHANIRRVLCTNEFGPGPIMSHFSFFRLRQSMALNLVEGGADVSTIMRVGRWNDAGTVENIAKLAQQTLRENYAAAMEKLTRKNVEFQSSGKSETMEQFMASED
jgi:site-specific recombinase XerD